MFVTTGYLDEVFFQNIQLDHFQRSVRIFDPFILRQLSNTVVAPRVNLIVLTVIN